MRAWRWLEVLRVAATASVVLSGDPGRADAAPREGTSAPAEPGPRPVEGRDLPPRVEARAGGARRAARDAGCLLFTDRARASTSEDCLACHRRGASAARRRECHPVAIDYARAARARSSLRPLDEVLRQRVFLPDNELRCVTCHDARSPWAFAVALPPGAVPKLEADAADPRTSRTSPPPPPPLPGERVSPAPLCLVCHLLG